MKKISFIFLITVVSVNKIKAQDPYFVQQLNSRTYLNPAMSGIDSTLVTSFASRFQWVGIDGPGTAYNSQLFVANQYVRFLRGGIGIDVMRDASVKSGFINNNYNLNYAPHFELFDHKLAIQVGLSAGYFEKSADWDKINANPEWRYYPHGFVSYYTLTPPLSYKQGWNLSSGIFAYTKNIYGGIGLMHLNQPEVGLITNSKLPIKINVNAGANFSFKNDTKKNLILSPNIVYTRQQAFHEFSIGINAKYKYFVTGLLYTNDSNIDAIIGFQNRFLKISYSGDIILSKLINPGYYSHEIHLVGFIHYQKKQCRIKTMRFI